MVGPAIGSAAGSAAQHELNNPGERTAQHRLVATAMLTTFLVIFISQAWWKKISDFVTAKTHGTGTTKPGG